MARSQKNKLDAADQAAHEEIAEKLLPALGIKLSKAEREAFVNGKKVSLENRSLAEFGSILIRAEALRHSDGESALLADVLNRPPSDGGGSAPTPYIKVKCVNLRRVKCCLEAGWPPYVAINCYGTF